MDEPESLNSPLSVALPYQETGLREIEESIAQLKRKGGTLQTNFFNQKLNGARLYAAAGEHTIVFLNDDLDFHRVYYSSTRIEELAGMLAGLTWQTNLVLGYITKARDEQLLAAFGQARYRLHTTFQKMRCDSFPRAKTNAALRYAEEPQVDELLARLRRDFDPYSNHLPTRDELVEYVRQRWVLVNCAKDQTGRVLGYVIFLVLGKQATCNFIFNDSGNALDWIMLQRNFYGLMQEQGIQRGFVWVESTNTEVIRMYQLQGWYSDGVIDDFFVRERA